MIIKKREQKKMKQKPNITITYCPKCGWMLRSAYMAQELLNTFTEEIYGVTLCPAEIGGVFTVRINEQLIFDRKTEERFPEIKELKKLIRDVVSPDKSLGHTDGKSS